jgi:phage terminase large subunit-like protein
MTGAATLTRTRKRSKASDSSADKATVWARQVVAGEVMAGPGVRASAARHLRDLEEGAERGLKYEREAAEHACAFFTEILHLNGGQYEGQPFNLLGWQRFVVSMSYGWKRANRTRRFRVVYVETGKGSGKSPLAAGIGLHGLAADGESRAEVYAAATKRDQAMILFRDAVAMFQQSPELARRLTASGVGEKTWNLAYLATGSFFRPIASEQGQSGPRPHVALVDELHEHPTNHVLEMLRAGFKSRRQPLLFVITNSGHDANSPAGQYHDYGLAVANGSATDDSFFSFVCGLDPEDDPFASEECWPKANPSLLEADLPGMEYLREEVQAARNLPSKQAIVRRLNFCQWTQAAAPWLSPEIWMPAAADYQIEDLRGRRAWGGLDLSSTTDLTALTLVVEPEHEAEPWKMLAYAWLPEEDLHHREQQDKVPYTQWAREGYLRTTPGRAVNRLAVLQQLMAIGSIVNLQAVAYDRWRIEDLKTLAADAAMTLPTMVEFGQGFRDLSPAVEEFERELLAGRIVHNRHPVLTWCAANAVIVDDDAGNRKLSKRKATGRIDCILAAVMARAIAQRREIVPQYQVLFL